ncbi:MAG: phosphate ABC transporter, permease protein PstA [Bdellovibrionaceae bacterium]|nr:phosphate ABC transporter, permease protein PstA [Pseudobdellovibrionaceae bacterium]|tara:strand:- start:52636 stop:53484 length:849 start_codon:yes stop_codon:yes gene_type:complete
MLIKINFSKIFATVFAGLVFLSMISILGDILVSAFEHLSLSFLLEDVESAGRKGGVFPVIVSTLLILMVCMLVVLPLGILTSIHLCKYHEKKSSLHFLIRKLIEVLSGVPSIVFGLFGNSFFSVILDMGFSILSGGLTLALMALPLFIYTFERGLSSVPQKDYLVGKSLGLSSWRIYKEIILPQATPSLIVASVLSIGRALAETAALIFTSGYVDRMPESLFDSGRALSVHIYDLAMNVPGGDRNAYNSAFVLMFLILSINAFFHLLHKFYLRKSKAVEEIS